MTETTPTTDPIRLLTSLRAIREYDGRPIPVPVLADILRVARWSGSARNDQPWDFIVVRDRETIARLAGVDGSAGFAAGAPLVIVIALAGGLKLRESYDEGRVSERMMLAAHAHGIGANTGWFSPTGGAAIKEMLAIPEGKWVRSMVAFGYPATTGRPGKPDVRKPLAEIAHEGRFGEPFGTE